LFRIHFFEKLFAVGFPYKHEFRTHVSQDLFQNSDGIFSPLSEREESWGKSHLTVAYGAVIVNDPTSHCKMRLAPGFFPFFKVVNGKTEVYENDV